jgi:hypothetical protein
VEVYLLSSLLEVVLLGDLLCEGGELVDVVGDATEELVEDLT